MNREDSGRDIALCRELDIASPGESVLGASPPRAMAVSYELPAAGDDGMGEDS